MPSADVGEASGGRHRAGHEQRELAGVAAVQRQRLQRVARDDLADGDRLRLQHRRLAATSTVSSSEPTSILKSSRAICLVSSAIGFVFAVLKP